MIFEPAYILAFWFLKKKKITQANQTSLVWTNFWFGMGKIFQKLKNLVWLEFFVRTESGLEHP